MWIFWALLSALLAASRRPLEKKIINEFHHFTYGFLIQCASLPVLAAITVATGNTRNPLELGLKFWLPVFTVSIGIYPLYVYLYKQAIKNSELSKVLPLQSLGPVFSLLLAWLIIREVPSIIASIGIILTVMGVYALGLKGKRLHHPLRPFKEDGGSRSMLCLVLLLSICSILDKIAVQVSNPLFYSFTVTLGAIFTSFIAMHMARQKVTANIRQFVKPLNIIGNLQSATATAYLFAIAVGPIAYVSALRSTNILMGSVLGLLLFKEKLTKPKIISALLIVIGAVLLMFG